MKKSKYLIFLIVVALIASVSCSKKVVPSEIIGAEDKSYDNAKFNYLYVEAVKQKLMGNGGDALKLLEDAVKLNPESDAAYYQMAQIVSANGDLGNGKRLLEKGN